MQISYFSGTLIQGINDSLSESINIHSRSAVHELRVKIKRLRSLLNILADTDGTFANYLSESGIKKLFKSAGKLRDVHVAKELVEKCGAEKNAFKAGEYYNYLEEQEIRSREKFLIVGRKFDRVKLKDLNGLISKRLKLIPENELEKTIGRNTASALMRVAARKNQEQFTDEDLHSLRIDAKDARYRIQVLTIIRDDLPPLQETDKWLRSVHRSIGHWHDFTLAQEELGDFLTVEADLPVLYPESYKTLMAEYTKEADEHRQTFLSVWRNNDEILNRSIDVIQEKWPTALGNFPPTGTIRTSAFLIDTISRN